MLTIVIFYLILNVFSMEKGIRIQFDTQTQHQMKDNVYMQIVIRSIHIQNKQNIQICNKSKFRWMHSILPAYYSSEFSLLIPFIHTVTLRAALCQCIQSVSEFLRRKRWCTYLLNAIVLESILSHSIYTIRIVGMWFSHLIWLGFWAFFHSFSLASRNAMVTERYGFNVLCVCVFKTKPICHQNPIYSNSNKQCMRRCICLLVYFKCVGIVSVNPKLFGRWKCFFFSRFYGNFF